MATLEDLARERGRKVSEQMAPSGTLTPSPPRPTPEPYVPPSPPPAAGATSDTPQPIHAEEGGQWDISEFGYRLSPDGIPFFVGPSNYEYKAPEPKIPLQVLGPTGQPEPYRPPTPPTGGVSLFSYAGRLLSYAEEEGFVPLGGRISSFLYGLGMRPVREGQWTWEKPSWNYIAKTLTMETDEARAFLREQPGTAQFLAVLVPEVAIMGRPGTIGAQAIGVAKAPYNVYRGFKGMAQTTRTLDEWYDATRAVQAAARAAGVEMSYSEAFTMMARERGLFAEGRLIPSLPELNEFVPTKDAWLKVGTWAERTPGLNWLMHTMNPSAAQFSEAMLKAYQWNSGLEAGAVSVGLARGQAELLLSRGKFTVDEAGRLVGVTARTKEGQKVGAFWQDVFEHPEWYNLTHPQEVAIHHLWKMTDEFKDAYVASGGKLVEMGYESDAHHVPRLVLGRKGIENIRGARQARRGVGGKKAWERNRIHQFVAEGDANGVLYERDILSTYDAIWQGLMAGTMDEKFIASMLPLGRKLTALIPADLDLGSTAGKLLVGWSRRLDSYAARISSAPETHIRVAAFRSASIEQAFPGVVAKYNEAAAQLRVTHGKLRAALRANAKLPRRPPRMPPPPRAAAAYGAPAKGFGVTTSRTVTKMPTAERGVIVRLDGVVPKKGFAVGVIKETVTKRLSGQAIDDFVQANLSLLKQKGNHLRVGYDTTAKQYELTVSRVYDTAREANAAGAKYRQDFYYDLAKGVMEDVRYYRRPAELLERTTLEAYRQTLREGVIAESRVSARAAINERNAKMEYLMNESRRPSGRLPGAMFNRPEEDFIAVGRLDSARFPGLTGNIFPQDVIMTLEATMADAGAAWARSVHSVASVSRTLGTTTDLNFGFLQGLLLLGRNPGKWAEALTYSFSALARPDVYQRYLLMKWHQAPQTMERYTRYVASLGEPEFFAAARTGGLLKRGLAKVPVAGPFVSKQVFGRFAGAFDTFLDVARMEWWQAMESTALARVAAGEVGALEDLGGVIRNGTGTSSLRRLGISRTQRDVEGAFFFFAPRYTRSLFALTFDALHGGIRGAEARRSLAGLAVTGAAMYSGICWALDQEPIFDPREPGFMAIRVGENWVGIGSGYRALIKLIGVSVKTAQEDPEAFLQIWGEDAMDNPLVRFVRSRTSPVTSTALDLMTGRDFIGRPTRQSWEDWAQLAQGRLTPFVVDAYLESKGGAADRWKAITGEFFFGRAIPMSPYQLRDEAVAREGYLLTLGPNRGKRIESYSDLAKDQRDEFDVKNPEYQEAIEDWRLSRDSPWSQLDDVNNRKMAALEAAATELANAGNDPYAGRAYRYTVIDLALYYQGEYAGMRAGIGADELQPRTEEQKLLDSYFRGVVEPAVKETGKLDYELFERYEREFLRGLSDDAAQRLFEMLGSSEDQTYRQFRMDKQVLRPYWDLLDSLWTPAVLGEFGLGFASTYGSFEEFRGDVLGQLTDELTGQKVWPEMYERFGTGVFSREQAQQLALTIFGAVTKDYSEFKTFTRNEYLKANPDQLKRLLTWGYMIDVPKDLEPFMYFE